MNLSMVKNRKHWQKSKNYLLDAEILKIVEIRDGQHPRPVPYHSCCYLDGESIALTGIIVGAIIGGVINAGVNVWRQISDGVSFQNLNWASVGVSFSAGAVSGGIAGSPIGLLGQVGFNAVISGVESALQDKLYGRDINWKQVGISAGIGGLAGFVGGEGASAPVKTVYGKIVGAGGVNTSVVYLTYSSRATAEAAAKSLSKGMTKGSLTQIIVTDNVVKFIYVE